MTETGRGDHGGIPEGTRWCPNCNGYGSSLNEAGERCSGCGGTGLVLVADPSEEDANGHDRTGSGARGMR